MGIVRAGETLRAKMTMRYNLESRIGVAVDIIA
jgi:hypothetical protein